LADLDPYAHDAQASADGPKAHTHTTRIASADGPKAHTNTTLKRLVG